MLTLHRSNIFWSVVNSRNITQTELLDKWVCINSGFMTMPISYLHICVLFWLIRNLCQLKIVETVNYSKCFLLLWLHVLTSTGYYLAFLPFSHDEMIITMQLHHINKLDFFCIIFGFVENVSSIDI